MAKKPSRNIDKASRALTFATTRTGGLQLLVTREGGVEIKPFYFVIKNELVLVRSGQGGRLRVLFGRHEIRLVGGRLAKKALIAWTDNADHSQQQSRGKVLYGQPKMHFDLY